MVSAATGGRGSTLSLFAVINAAATIPLATKHGIDDRGGTARPRPDGKGACGTIPAAGAAFNTGIAMDNPDPPLLHFQNLTRTDLQAHSAANALSWIKLKGYDIFQIQ